MSHDRSVMRLFDAAVNRSVEGVRVLEDMARMLFDDSLMTAECKNLRHDILKPVRADRAFQRALIEGRASDRDVLRAGETASEKSRSDLVSIARANAKRAQEALRSLEEFSKLVQPRYSDHYKQCRFAVYDFEKRLVLKLCRMDRLDSCRVRAIPLLSVTYTGNDLSRTVTACIDAGARCIVFEGAGESDRTFVDAVLPIRDECRERDVSVIIAGRADCAVVTGADGVMSCKGALSVAEMREVAGECTVTGIMTDSTRLSVCESAGADVMLITSSGDSLPDRISSVRKVSGCFSGMIVMEVESKEVRHDLLSECVVAGCNGFAFRVGNCEGDYEELAACLKTVLPDEEPDSGGTDYSVPSG